MVKQNVLIVLGSPRKNGNSTILANKCADGAREAGADVEVVALQGLDIAPCNACDACIKKPGAGCVINDDMIPLYKKIEQATAIVFATPTYWFNMSAQLKLFIDRAYALRPGKEKYAFSDKKVGIIMTYADVDPFAAGAVNALRSFQDICNFVGATIVGMVHGSAEQPGDIKKNEAIMKSAFDLGKKLAS
ncbi:MAG: flavodoxin family protein [Candidatus Sigynarchaeota archaeon]